MWRRLIFPTVIVALSWLMVSGATTYYIYWLNQSYQRVFAENVEAIYSASRVQEAAWKAVADVTADSPEPALTADAIAANLEVLQNECEKLTRISFTEPEIKLSQELRGLIVAFKELVPSFVDSSSRMDDSKRIALRYELSKLAAQIARATNQVRDINRKLLLDANDRRENATTSVFVVRLCVLIVGPGLGIAYGWWMGRRMQRTVARITVTLRDATSGDRPLGAVVVDQTADLDVIQSQVEHVVSHLNQANDELKKARDEVLRSERLAAVGELAAGVAHELRNPLTSVKLLLQHAAQRAGSDPLSDTKLQLILDEIGRMESTIQGLLDFSRPTRLNRSRHDVRNSLNRAINLVIGRAQQQHVQISTDLGEHPLMVDADPEKLHQVFVNLLLNGLESMPNGGRLTLNAAAAMEKPEIQIKVRDTGKGIPEDILRRLFEPFATSKDRGTGLGLAVSRRIVTEHHGTIVASNEDGAVFQVNLPAV